MSKNKNNKKGQKGHQKAPEPPKRRGIHPALFGAVAFVAVMAIVIAVSGGGGSDGGAAGGADSEYVGRLLPDGYTAPSVAEPALYTSAVAMTPVAATQDETSVSVALADVTDNKIVRFDYTRSAGDILPMIAYIRPSGKLFVGVSYCPPCEGEGQRIDSDGTLTCESCGTKRNLENNDGLSGACKLYPLDEVPATVNGADIIVDSGVLDNWVAQPLDRPVG